MAETSATIRFRGVFKQGDYATTIILITQADGTPVDPDSISYTVTRNSDGEVVVTTSIPEKVGVGVYVFDWLVPTDAEVGPYTIRWEYEIDGETVVSSEGIVVGADNANIDSRLYSGRILQMRQSLEMMICCVLHMPVYFQQAQPSRDRRKFYFTKGNWNPTARNRIYLNKEVATEGYTIDYEEGSVTFDEQLSDYDTVHADYNFRWFTDAQLDRFLSNGLHALNIAPPASPYTLNTLPDRFIPTVLYVAARDALRVLILCLQTEQPAQFFGGSEAAQARSQMLETLKQNYEKDMEFFLSLKKLGPYPKTRMVVTPEFTLPGGRSRWFRYLYSGSTAAG